MLAAFTNSIRWRFQLWLTSLLVCALSGFGVAVYQLYRVNQLDGIDEELEHRTAALSSALRRPPLWLRPGAPPPRGWPDELPSGYGTRKLPPRDVPGQRQPDEREEARWRALDFQMPEDTLSLFGTTDTNAFYFIIWSRDGTVFQRSDNAAADAPPPSRERGDARNRIRMRGDYREAYYFLERGDCVLAGRLITSDLEAMQRFGWWLLAAGGLVLSFGLGGGWWLTSSALRPVKEISAAARRIAAGNLSERINVAETSNELGNLAVVLNSTFARLEAAFVQQKQFTADASHELRTPLAVIISEAQTTLARERTSSEYRETIEGCLETAQQMRRLTDSLLELARFDAGQQCIQHSPLDLAEVVLACVEQIKPLAEARGVSMLCDLKPAEFSGDATRLSQVVTNLLSNAIHYNRTGGEIRVAVRSDEHFAILAVADTGVGISDEDMPRIFERFYRGDKARARADGRNGLGLAISKAIVDAHGGRIEVKSETGAGTVFTVCLPRQN